MLKKLVFWPKLVKGFFGLAEIRPPLLTESKNKNRFLCLPLLTKFENDGTINNHRQKKNELNAHYSTWNDG